jgi:hypothetical protein
VKELAGCCESQPLPEPMMQYILDHSQFLISDGFRGSFLQDLMHCLLIREVLAVVNFSTN